MPIHLTHQTVDVRLSGTWTAVDHSAIIHASAGLTMSANGDNPLAPGDDTRASGSVELLRTAALFAWQQTPIRVTSTFDGSTGRVFVGVITGYEDDGAVRTLHCGGLDTLMRTQKLHSPLFSGRPIATVPTGSSDELAGGVLNWLAWSCGGRPAQQSAAYPNAVFYYDFDASVLDPPYAWVAGDDAWQEAQKLCQASGGRLYQDEQGWLIYRSPLRLNSLVSGVALTNDTFRAIRERASTKQAAGAIVVPYTRRMVLSAQQVFEDTTPRVIAGGATSEPILIAPRWPVASYQRYELTVCDLMGTAVPENATTGYTYSVTTAAQQATVTITNHTGAPVVVYRIAGIGQPLVAGEAANAKSGTGTPERAVPDNEFIQDDAHAARLARLLLDLYTPTPTRTVDEALWDASVNLGDVVPVTDADLGLSSTPHLLVGRDDDGGELVTYTATSVAHLPRLDDLFRFEVTYADGDVRQYGY